MARVSCLFPPFRQPFPCLSSPNCIFCSSGLVGLFSSFSFFSCSISGTESCICVYSWPLCVFSLMQHHAHNRWRKETRTDLKQTRRQTTRSYFRPWSFTASKMMKNKSPKKISCKSANGMNLARPIFKKNVTTAIWGISFRVLWNYRPA